MRPRLPLSGTDLILTDYIFLAAAAAFAIAVLFRQMPVTPDRLYILFGLYAVGLTLATLFSSEPRRSMIKLAGDLYLIGIAVLTVNVVHSPKILRRVTLVWITAAALIAAACCAAVLFFYAGISNSLTEIAIHPHFGSLPPGRYPLLQGGFFYPALLCNYLTVSLMLVLSAWEQRWLGTTLFALLIIMIGISIAFSITPGIGGALLALGLWLAYRFWGRKPLLGRTAFALGIIAAAAFLLICVVTPFSSPNSAAEWAIGGVHLEPGPRLLTWTAAFYTFLEHPLLGNGLGLPVAVVYFTPPSGEMQLLTDAHNFILNIAGQAGLAGILPLLAVCVYTLRRGWALASLEGENSALYRNLLLAFFSAFIFQGMVGSFEDCRYLWVLVGLIAGESKSSPGRTINDDSEAA
jgi:O-antigen ligase